MSSGRMSFRVALSLAAAAALSLTQQAVPARAQSADLVLCDRLAADPADPDKPRDVKGVAQIEPSDIATAIRFCRVASGSSRRAMYALGRAYAAKGQANEAVAAFRRAADKGSTAAMVELGVMLATGAGVPNDPAQARRLFERAAQAGDPRGVSNLAALSGQAGGAAADPTRSRAMLTAAAERNSAEAQFQLGVMMGEGKGGPQDDVGARAMFERAAAQNHAGALERLGTFAKDGRGGPQDKDAAKRYFERAAALGSEEAKVALKNLACPIVLKDKQGKVWGNLCF
jgi:TPR repeat protein